MNNQKIITQTINKFNEIKPNDVGMIDISFYSKQIDHRNIYYYYAVIDRVAKDIVAKERDLILNNLDIIKCLNYIEDKYSELISEKYTSFLKEYLKKGGIRDMQFELKAVKITQKDVQTLVISSIYLLNIHNVIMDKLDINNK